MSIKYFLRKLWAKLTGRKCSRCRHNCGGRCAHPDGTMFMRCWHSITRPGFEYSESVQYARTAGQAVAEGFQAGIDHAAGDLTDEEKHQLAKIVTSLQEASKTAQDAGLVESRPVWEDKTESGLLEEE